MVLVYRQRVVARSYRPVGPAASSMFLVDQDHRLRSHRIPAMLPCWKKGDSEQLDGRFRLCSEGNVLVSHQAPCMSPLSCRSNPRVWLAELDGLGHHNKDYDFGLGRVSLALRPELKKVDPTFSPLSWT